MARLSAGLTHHAPRLARLDQALLGAAVSASRGA